MVSGQGPEAAGPPGNASHLETHSIPSFPPCTDDKLEQQHSLFTRYKDPCRLGPGEEKPWAIGELGRERGAAGGEPGRGRVTAKFQAHMLRPGTALRMGSPQASQRDYQDLSPDLTAGDTQQLGWDTQACGHPRLPLLPQEGGPPRG